MIPKRIQKVLLARKGQLAARRWGIADPRGFLKVKRAGPETPAAGLIADSKSSRSGRRRGSRPRRSRCMDAASRSVIRAVHALGNVIPEFNDAVYRGRMDDAARILSSTNNFPR